MTNYQDILDGARVRERQRRAAQTIDRPLTPTAPDNGGAKPNGFIPLADLLAEPDDAVPWVVEGLIPMAGLALLTAKPKVGKSTLSRAVALAVAQGRPILGRSTEQGPVLYLGLEDPRRVIREHFRKMGATGEEPLFIFSGRQPTEAVAWLVASMDRYAPVLVVIDSLQFFSAMRDTNDYSVAVEALRAILDVLRVRQTAGLATHHDGKGGRVGVDGILGSTGLGGTTDIHIQLRRRESDRTINTTQRMGEDLQESVLLLDATGTPQVAGTRADYDAEQAGARVLAWLGKQTERATRADVISGAGGDANENTRALYAHVKAGTADRTGKGVSGDPYLYFLHACINPIVHATMQETKNGQELSNGGPNACMPKSPLLTPAAEPPMQVFGHSDACDCPTCYPVAAPALQGRP